MVDIEPKKITILCARHSAFDGRVFQLEARELARVGHKVTLIAPRLNNEPPRQVVDGVRIITYEKAKSLLVRKYHTIATLVRLAMHYRGDVFHVHEMDSSLMAAVITKKKLQKKGIPVKLIFDSHEVWPYFYATFRKNPFLRRIIVHLVTEFENWVVRKHVDAVIAAHELETNYYLWQHPWTPAFCVVGAPPLDQWPEPKARSGPIRTLGHDGFFSLQRGMDVMLGAFEILANEYPDLTFLAAGDFMSDTDRDWYEEWTARTGLGDRVTTTGWVDRRDILDYLEQMDIGLVANRQDIHSVRCWPANKMMYYMGRGLPVVSTPAPLYKRYIDANKCGQTANQFSSSAMANALRTMLDNPDQTREMGRNGYRAVLRDFHPAQALKNLHAAYTSLTEEVQVVDEQVTLQGA